MPVCPQQDKGFQGFPSESKKPLSRYALVLENRYALLEQLKKRFVSPYENV